MEKSFVDGAIRKALERSSRESQCQCPDPNQVAAYLESRCDLVERARLEDHFAGCAPCQQVLALSLKVSEMDGLETGICEPPERRRVLFRVSIPVSLAAVTAIVVLAAVFIPRSLWQKRVAETASLRTPANLPERSIPSLANAPSSAEPPKISAPQGEAAKDAGQRGAVPSPGVAVGGVAAGKSVPVKSLEKKAKERERGEDKPAGLESRPLPPTQVAAEESNKAEKMKSRTPAANQALAQNTAVANQAQLQNAGAILDRAAMQNEPPQLRNAPDRFQAQRTAQSQRAAPVQAAQGLAPVRAISERPQDAIAAISAATPAAREAVPVKKIAGRTFYRWADYWIDSQCLDNSNVPLIEAFEGTSAYDEAAGQIPSIWELQSAGVPILLFWNGKVYLLR